MTEQTPAQRQAALLYALGDHLTANPHLAAVNIGSDEELQIKHGESVSSLMAWARTLINPKIGISPVADWTRVAVTGSIGDREVTVWTTDHAELHRLVGPDATIARPTPITLADLEAYVVRGCLGAE